MNIKRYAQIALTLLLGALLVLIVQMTTTPQEARMEDISGLGGLYSLQSGSLTQTVGAGNTFTSTTLRYNHFGSVYMQVVQDVLTSTTVTYTPQVALDGTYGGSCSQVQNWSDLAEQVLVRTPAVAADRYISYTVNETGTIQSTLTGSTTGTITNAFVNTTTYYYETVPAVAASVDLVEVNRTFSIVGDGNQGLLMPMAGAYCMRLVGQVGTTTTITAAITASPIDVIK